MWLSCVFCPVELESLCWPPEVPASALLVILGAKPADGGGAADVWIALDSWDAPDSPEVLVMGYCTELWPTRNRPTMKLPIIRITMRHT